MKVEWHKYDARLGTGKVNLHKLHAVLHYDSKYVPKLLNYCKNNLDNISNQGFGHWHYAHFYYSQVLYREGGKDWERYRDKIFPRLVSEAGSDGSWSQGYIGTVYTTATNLIILQLPKGTLPIYQR